MNITGVSEWKSENNSLTIDQKKTTSELLHEDNSLALVGATQEDDDCAWGKAGPQPALVLTEGLLAAIQFPWEVLSWVVTGLWVQRNDSKY